MAVTMPLNQSTFLDTKPGEFSSAVNALLSLNRSTFSKKKLEQISTLQSKDDTGLKNKLPYHDFALKLTEQIFEKLKRDAIESGRGQQSVDPLVFAKHLSVLQLVFSIVYVEVQRMCGVTMNGNYATLQYLRALCSEFLLPQGQHVPKATVMLYLSKTVQELDEAFKNAGVGNILGSVRLALDRTFNNIREQTLLRNKSSQHKTHVDALRASGRNEKRSRSTSPSSENCRNVQNTVSDNEDTDPTKSPRFTILMKVADWDKACDIEKKRKRITSKTLPPGNKRARRVLVWSKEKKSKQLRTARK